MGFTQWGSKVDATWSSILIFGDVLLGVTFEVDIPALCCWVWPLRAMPGVPEFWSPRFWLARMANHENSTKEPSP